MNQLALFSLLLTLGRRPSFAQRTQRQMGDCVVFTIPFANSFPGDSITFAVVAPKGDLLKRKPIFLFRQGSLPIPLFTVNPKTGKTALTELPRTGYDQEPEQYSLMIASRHRRCTRQRT
ncbi:hypothetical protein [Fibrella arboris]|uniref:hypothetical protein n=1 Tax=Fibrella arboris TaxID=3242486 RepID=UPI003522FEFA